LNAVFLIRTAVFTNKHASFSTFTVYDRYRWEGVDWIHLAQDRDQWWALVNMVMNLRVP